MEDQAGLVLLSGNKGLHEMGSMAAPQNNKQVSCL